MTSRSNINDKAKQPASGNTAALDAHLTPETLDAYRHGTLSAEALLTADDHVAACPDCRRAAWEREIALTASIVPPPYSSAQAGFLDFETDEEAETDEHLTYAQMEAYVDNKVDEIDREIVEGHLLLCDSCVEEVRDLRAFRAERTTYPNREYAPQPERSLWDRLMGPFRGLSPMTRAGLGWAAAGAVGVIAVVGSTQMATSPLRTEVATLRQQVAQNAGERDQKVQELQSQLAQAEKRAQDASVAASTSREAAQKEVTELRSKLVALQQQQKQNVPSVSPTNNIQAPDIPPVPVAAPIIAQLGSGNTTVALRKDGTVSGLPSSTSTAVRQQVASALRTGVLDVPASARSLISQTGTLMSPEEMPRDTPHLMSPLGTRVLSARPIFNWTPVAGAVSYRIDIVDATDYSKVMESPVISGKTTWQPSTPLPRGRALTWQVNAYFSESSGLDPVKGPKQTEPEAKFAVLPESEARTVEAQVRSASGSPLALAALYAKYGLLDNAQAAVEDMTEKNPRDPLAKKLQDSLTKLRTGSSQ